MARFAYPCPDCRTGTNLHDAGCEFDGTRWTEIETAYVGLVAELAAGDRGVEPDALRAVLDWTPLHEAALGQLRRTRRVVEEDGRLRLLTAAEYTERVAHPSMEPLRTIYEKGSVPGAHDNSIFALIAFYEMVGLTWTETRERTVEWLRESGSWDRGGFEEDSPEEVVDNKRHVYEQGYGWKQAGREAKAVIDRRL